MSELALELAPHVAAAARGDQRAFARLVDATRNTVTSISLAILRDVELSRDVAQDVYLMVWRDLRKLREPTSFLPWLRQLTRNRAHQALRTHVRARRRFEGDADALLAAAADPRPDAVERLVVAEERAALAQAIDELPAAAREVVVLYYREGQSAAQVAELLDLSEDAVKQRLSRARSRLRALLETQLQGTAPTAAFTAAVLAGIATVAAPAAAGAAVVSAGKAAKVGGVIPMIGGAAVFGMFAGLVGGWGGVLFGTRDLLRLARDDDERRSVIQAGAVSMLGILAFAGAIFFWPTPLAATIGFAIMFAMLGVVHFIWLPRATRRRHEAELLEDPVGAAVTHARRRRQAVLGCGLGFLFGGASVLASWFY